MSKELTENQYWELLQKIPPELKEALFSEKTANNIFNIAERNNVEELQTLSGYVGDVLLGILPPDGFQEVLEKEIGIETRTAKRVAMEIYRFIFHPVKESLEELYKIEIAPLAKMKVTPPPQERPPTPPKKDDVYRELIGEDKGGV